MKHFLIYTNKHKDQELATTKRIRDYLESKGCTVKLKIKEADWKEEADSGVEEEATDIPLDVDCMIVLGGDGTVLQAARETKKILVPIIGVNLGTVGYMTEIELSGLEESLDRLIRDDYKKERRMMLNGKVCCADGTVSEGWALNDIVISRSGTLQIIEFNIYVNGQLLNHYKADGMIVTTPTGSTGYNLSAGGPLVEPKAKLITLTPICPHSLNQRSIILSPEDEIVIEIPGGREGKSQTVEANYDGSHKELAGYLKEAGFTVTQATVSRDIRELKLSKVPTGGGKQKYVILRQDDSHMGDKYIRVLRDGFVSMDMAQNILVIKTVSGMAMAVAAALDALKFSEVVGCIAGDDTIMVAVRTVEDTQILMDKIHLMIER